MWDVFIFLSYINVCVSWGNGKGGGKGTAMPMLKKLFVDDIIKHNVNNG